MEPFQTKYEIKLYFEPQQSPDSNFHPEYFGHFGSNEVLDTCYSQKFQFPQEHHIHPKLIKSENRLN